MASVTVATYDKGDVVRIEASVAVSGTPTNPTLSTLQVRDPTGALTSYTIANGGLTNPTVGLLSHDHDTTSAAPGEYWYGFTGTGTAQVYEEGRYYVQARQVA
jgi:hypothetical protein